MKASHVLLLIAGISLMACAEASDFSAPDNADKLLNSQPTTARPEVGSLALGQSLCTGTLIRPTIVLTAAHCVDYQSRVQAYGTFNTDRGQNFPITGALSFGNDTGPKDFALLELGTPVPANIASPASIHAGSAPLGVSASIYGFGCNNRQTEEGAAHGAKQVVHFTVGQMTRNLCPGDSGGPVFVNGGVVWVNSAYYTQSGNDLFAEVGLMHQLVNQYADRIISRGMTTVISELRQSQNAGDQSGVHPDQGQGKPENQSQDHAGQGDHLNQDSGDQTQLDFCEQNGYYGDHYCDQGCPKPDPDCQSQTQPDQQDGTYDDNQGQDYGSSPSDGDLCELEGYYGDGWCDSFCDQPDPDCHGQQHTDPYDNGSQGHSDGGYDQGYSDICETEGYYNDGICDDFCDYPDPDCSQGYGDSGDDGYWGDDGYDGYKD